MKYSRLKLILAIRCLGVVAALVVPVVQADLFVSSQTGPTANTVLRYSDTSGAFLGVFASGGGVNDPLGMAFGPDGNLYLASGNTDQVLRYHGGNGVFLGVFASGGGLQGPINVTFGPDGNLYVSSSSSSQVLRYNGSTGAFMDVFASGGGLSIPRGLKFGPDGNLYVVSYNTASVLRYSGTTGAFMDAFVLAGSGGLFTPNDLAFGPDGNLYVTGGTFPNPGVFRYHGTTGAFIDQFASVGNTGFPIDMSFGRDGNLYVVVQGAANGVVRFNGNTGAFIDQFVSPGSGGLENPFGLVFSPNNPPTVSCPVGVTLECGTSAEVIADVSDADGGGLTVVWAVNGQAVQTNTVPAGTPPLTTNVSFSADLPPGTNTVAVTVRDTTGNTASCSTTVTVVDTMPPVIAFASAYPSVLWPPNHKMVMVNVRARVSDNCGPPAWRIIGVRSNEPVNGKGDGDTAPDWIITGNHTVKLRSERSGNGRGRSYFITIQASDTAGNFSAIRIVTVTVPKSQGHR